MTLTGKLKDLTMNFKEYGQTLSLDINEDFRPYFDKFKDTELSIEIKPFKKHRSLDANAYAWVLINKIAGVLHTSKDEVYIEMLKRYGQHEIISVREDVDISPFVKYYEKIGETDLNGKHFIHYRVFVGSSAYDSKEMSDFIDGIISEAKEMNIETETPEEIARILCQ